MSALLFPGPLPAFSARPGRLAQAPQYVAHLEAKRLGVLTHDVDDDDLRPASSILAQERDAGGSAFALPGLRADRIVVGDFSSEARHEAVRAWLQGCIGDVDWASSEIEWSNADDLAFVRIAAPADEKSGSPVSLLVYLQLVDDEAGQRWARHHADVRRAISHGMEEGVMSEALGAKLRAIPAPAGPFTWIVGDATLTNLNRRIGECMPFTLGC